MVLTVPAIDRVFLDRYFRKPSHESHASFHLPALTLVALRPVACADHAPSLVVATSTSQRVDRNFIVFFQIGSYASDVSARQALDKATLIARAG